MLIACAALTQAGATDLIAPPEGTPRPEYAFTPEDLKLLDEIQYAAFQYFWKEVGQPAGLVKDTIRNTVSSIAAVGFQLAALPIGVERGWVTREQATQRAVSVLRALVERDDNKKFGIYLHYPDPATGGLSAVGWTSEASTVDSALLFAGAMAAAEYFKGDVARLVDRMLADANWKAYAVAPGGLVSMAWDPDRKDDLAGGPGKFIPAHWHMASDEERLVYFLGVGAPTAAHALPPESYYQLKRPVKAHGDMPPFVVSPPGCLFTYFFAHCYIEYRALGPDDPAAFGQPGPRVDWFENSRRATLTHRQRCIELSPRFTTLSAERWGLSPCVGKTGYIVPQTPPNSGGAEDWHEGTVAPYAAGSSIMFTPAESMTALRAFRTLAGPDGRPLLWRDPKDGGYGLADSFNLDQPHVSWEIVGIDQGPLLVAIENARTGLIWRLFMSHPAARRAVERLKLAPR